MGGGLGTNLILVPKRPENDRKLRESATVSREGLEGRNRAQPCGFRPSLNSQSDTFAMQKVEGSSPFIRFECPH